MRSSDARARAKLLLARTHADAASPDHQGATPHQISVNMVQAFVVGAVGQLDKPAANSAQGKYFFIASANGTEEVQSAKYKLELYATHDEARNSAIVHVLKAAGKTVDNFPDQFAAAGESSIIGELNGQTRRTIASKCTGYRDLVNPVATPQQDDEAHVINSLVGVKVYQFFGGTHDVVEGTIVNANASEGTYTVEWTEGGETKSISHSKEYVKSKLKQPSPYSEIPPDKWTIDGSELDEEVLDILKKLRYSSLIESNGLDGDEMVSVARGLGALSPLHKVIKTGARDAYYVGTIDDAFKKLVEDGVDLKEDTWPTTAAALVRLLKQKSTIEVDLGETQSDPTKPLYSAIMTKCTDADGIKALEKAIITTLVKDKSRHSLLLSHETYTVGAVERELKKLKITEHMINEKFKEKQTSVIVMDWILEIESDASDAPDKEKTPPPPQNPLPGANGYYGYGSSSNETAQGEELAVKQATRAAIASVLKDKAKTEKVEKYYTMAIQSPPDYAALHKMKTDESDPDILRLFDAPVEDMGKVLQGAAPEGMNLMISRVRSTLDRRIEVCLYGNKLPSEEVKKAIQWCRLGRLSKCRIGHLVGKTDGGSAKQPLLFAKTHGKETLFSALHSMQNVVTMAFPSQVGAAMRFFTKLKEYISIHFDRGAEWDSISEWYRDILKHVERDVQLYGVAGATFEVKLHFDEAFIMARDYEHNERIFFETLETKGSRNPGGKDTPRNPGGKDRVKRPGQDTPDPTRQQKSQKVADAEKDGFVKKNGDKVMPYWSEAVKKKFADAQSKHGKRGTKIPCGFHFAGKCTDKKCPYPHVGTAGSS